MAEPHGVAESLLSCRIRLPSCVQQHHAGDSICACTQQPIQHLAVDCSPATAVKTRKQRKAVYTSTDVQNTTHIVQLGMCRCKQIPTQPTGSITVPGQSSTCGMHNRTPKARRKHLSSTYLHMFTVTDRPSMSAASWSVTMNGIRYFGAQAGHPPAGHQPYCWPPCAGSLSHLTVCRQLCAGCGPERTTQWALAPGHP